MSAGAFIRTLYQLDTGNGGGVCRLEIQPETELLTDGTTVNDAPAGPVTIPITAKVSLGNGANGIKPRSITFAWDDGQQPVNYTGDPLRIPILTEAAFAAYQLGTQLTYLGGTGEVVGRNPERVR